MQSINETSCASIPQAWIGILGWPLEGGAQAADAREERAGIPGAVDLLRLRVFPGDVPVVMGDAVLASIDVGGFRAA